MGWIIIYIASNTNSDNNYYNDVKRLKDLNLIKKIKDEMIFYLKTPRHIYYL